MISIILSYIRWVADLGQPLKTIQERDSRQMITLNTFNRRHTDVEYVDIAYAMGYSYITRKSKLNAAIEYLGTLAILTTLFFYCCDSRNTFYIELIPYIILVRDGVVLADNIFTVLKCDDDRLGNCLKTGSEVGFWLLYVLLIDIINFGYFWARLLAAIRVLIEIGILVRFFIYLKKRGSDQYHNLGQGLVWATTIWFFFLWMNNTFSWASLYLMSMPVFLYVCVLIISGYVRLGLRMFAVEGGYRFEKNYILAFLEIKFYFLLLFFDYCLTGFVERLGSDYFTCCCLIVIIAVIISLFYGVVLATGEINQNLPPVQQSNMGDYEDDEEDGDESQQMMHGDDIDSDDQDEEEEVRSITRMAQFHSQKWIFSQESKRTSYRQISNPQTSQKAGNYDSYPPHSSKQINLIIT